MKVYSIKYMYNAHAELIFIRVFNLSFYVDSYSFLIINPE